MYGDDLCSGTTSGDDLGVVGKIGVENTWTSRVVDLSPNINLVAGIEYAIIVRTSGAVGEWAYAYAKREGDYSGGESYSSSDSGTTWSLQDLGVGHDNPDMRFYTGNATDSYTPTPEAGPFEGLNMGVQGNTWKAQTISVTENHTLTAITILFGKAYNDSPGTITVSVRDMKPAKPTDPSPTDANANISLSQETIAWEDGGAADTFDVYYGIESGSLTKVSTAQAGTSFTISGITNGSPFDYLITRYWRIDATNTSGTTTGDEWYFATFRLDPPTTTLFYATTGQYYRLLIQSDGSYGDPPGVGVEDTDYEYLTTGYEANFIQSFRKLVCAANSKIWHEDI